MSVWEVADVLRLPERGPFVVVAAESVPLAQEALPGIENRLWASRIGSARRLTPDAQIGIVRFETDAGLRPLTSTRTESARGRIGVNSPYLALTDTAAALRFARIALASTVAGTPHVTMFPCRRSGQRARRDAASPAGRARADPRPAPGARQGPPRHLGRVAGQRGIGVGRRGRSVLPPQHSPPPVARVEVATGRSLGDPTATAEILIALEAALLGIAQQ